MKLIIFVMAGLLALKGVDAIQLQNTNKNHLIGIHKDDLLQEQIPHWQQEWPLGDTDDGTNDADVLNMGPLDKKKKKEDEFYFNYTLDEDVITTQDSIETAEKLTEEKLHLDSVHDGGMDMVGKNFYSGYVPKNVKTIKEDEEEANGLNIPEKSEERSIKKTKGKNKKKKQQKKKAKKEEEPAEEQEEKPKKKKEEAKKEEKEESKEEEPPKEEKAEEKAEKKEEKEAPKEEEEPKEEKPKPKKKPAKKEKKPSKKSKLQIADEREREDNFAFSSQLETFNDIDYDFD